LPLERVQGSEGGFERGFLVDHLREAALDGGAGGGEAVGDFMFFHALSPSRSVRSDIVSR
jgi:hypothetical protein